MSENKAVEKRHGTRQDVEKGHASVSTANKPPTKPPRASADSATTTTAPKKGSS